MSDQILLLQTPNAVDWTKRWQMLTGRNPFELTREERSNPGHYREYMFHELKKKRFDLNNFMDHLVPCNLRTGITLVLRKTGTAA